MKRLPRIFALCRCRLFIVVSVDLHSQSDRSTRSSVGPGRPWRHTSAGANSRADDSRAAGG